MLPDEAVYWVVYPTMSSLSWWEWYISVADAFQWPDAKSQDRYPSKSGKVYVNMSDSLFAFLFFIFFFYCHEALDSYNDLPWDFGSCFTCSCRRLYKISPRTFLQSAILWCRNAGSPNIQYLLSWCYIFLAVPSTAHLPAHSSAVKPRGRIDSCKRHDQMFFLSLHSEASSDLYKCTSFS